MSPTNVNISDITEKPEEYIDPIKNIGINAGKILAGIREFIFGVITHIVRMFKPDAVLPSWLKLIIGFAVIVVSVWLTFMFLTRIGTTAITIILIIVFIFMVLMFVLWMLDLV